MRLNQFQADVTKTWHLKTDATEKKSSDPARLKHAYSGFARLRIDRRRRMTEQETKKFLSGAISLFLSR